MHQIIIPERLRTGDTVALTATSSAVTEDQVSQARLYLETKGFRVQIGATMTRKERYLAGGDEERADELNRLFAEPTIRGIFAARGGYGSARLLDKLDYECIRANSKVFVGFSDTTALQFALYARAGLVSYTGLAICADVKEGRVSRSIEESLWGVIREGRGNTVSGLQVVQKGQARGPLIAGCLSVMCATVGTPYWPDVDGAILLIEDVNEAPYRIDRMLTQLRLAGVLARIGGLIYGRFENCVPKNEEDGPLARVLEEFARWIKGPVVGGFPYGHFADRVVVPLGIPAIMTADDRSGSVGIEDTVTRETRATCA